jgi:SRSO17 transposase
VDETGFLKKSVKSAGVKRQYSGTAGRVENCHRGVFCAYVTGKGRALIDREPYLPKSWLADAKRCREAAVPEEAEFATKTDLAQTILGRAIDAGIPAVWASSSRLTTCAAPPPGTTEEDLIRVASSRWAVEECFQTTKTETGLDQYQVRRYDASYRHVTLAMLAHACLAVTTATNPKALAAASSRSHSARSAVSWHT